MTRGSTSAGPAVRFEAVTVRYADAATPALADVDLTVDEGQLSLVIGTTGSGKSTLLRCVNGLVPHFTGGTLAGRVQVCGLDTREYRPRDLAEVVGYVGQDPAAGFVTDTVEEELAYGMESLGLPGGVMRQRVEETLDLLGLADVRERALRTLSGGQAQRVAIGGVLAAHPRVLVLDEPTSALDPVAAEEVLSALTRLVHDLGLTVVLAEHRLERVLQHADQVVTVQDGRVRSADPAVAMTRSPVVPPIVELGRLAGWRPLPLSVREARRAHARNPVPGVGEAVPVPGPAAGRPAATAAAPRPASSTAAGARSASGAVALDVRDLVVRRGGQPVLRGVGLTVRTGQVVAIMGRNGAGKSTMLLACAGQLRASAGTVRTAGSDPAKLRPGDLVQQVGLVPADPGSLLYAASVAAECRAADHDLRVEPGSTRAVLHQVAPDVHDEAHPRELSEGERLALALAVVLAGRPPVLLLDEPTRGLDYGAKTQLVRQLRELAAGDRAVVLATHDVELAAEVADRVVVLADGEAVADGPAGQVLAGSPAFAPQVAKVLHPDPWLTVAQVAGALTAVGSP
ncbi:MAG: ABC transporter ATP-binding protein [Angustibacter sp.]